MVIWCVQVSAMQCVLVQSLGGAQALPKFVLINIGPNEITLFTPDALLALHGAGSSCKKGDWYDFMLPDVSLHSSRDKVVHDQRRRIWDQAFSMKGWISLVLGYSNTALTNTSFTQLRKSS